MSEMIQRLKLLWKITKKAVICVFERILHPGAAYLVLTPEHGNLGDHAIARAEKILLNKEHIRVIEVTGKELQRRRELGLLRLMNGRTIYINGGGNLGTLWFSVEKLIRAVIQQNPRSDIIIFPSTIFYEDSEFGNREKQRSVEIYNKHKKLTVFLREEKSYQIAADLYPNAEVKLMPDMVMLLNYSEPQVQRHGCIICLRRDVERTMSDEQELLIKTQVEEMFGPAYYYLDMVLDHGIPIKRRNEELSSQINKFKQAELVITDRLHGMVFCAISGTPCIVVESRSHKVQGCFEWIRDLEYIRFCDSIQNLKDVFASIPKKEFAYDNTHLLGCYESMIKSIDKR